MKTRIVLAQMLALALTLIGAALTMAMQTGAGTNIPPPRPKGFALAMTPLASLKPNGEVYRDLVFKRWWTNVNGKTGGQGTFATRGFLGDYEIEVKAGGKSKTVRVSLPKECARIGNLD